MPNLLVTGGCGFIGSSFVRLALRRSAGLRLVNLDALTYAGDARNLDDVSDDPRYRFVRGDVCDRDLVGRLFAEHDIDTVVHFAAESHVDRSILGPGEFVRTNVTGTYTLIETARRAWLGDRVRGPDRTPRFVHVSTDEVYGSLGESGTFTERTAYDPRSPYSASKAASDHLVRAYAHSYGLPALVTHGSNTYGPYQFPEKLIPLVIRNAIRGEPLPVYGDGGNVRDWLHVDDHCEAIWTVLERGRPGRSYNIGGGNERRNLEVVETVCSLLDERLGPAPDGIPRRSLIRFVDDRPGHDRRYALDCSRIRRELEWTPKVLFEDGMRRTVDWYIDHAAWVESVLDGSGRTYGKHPAPKARGELP